MTSCRRTELPCLTKIPRRARPLLAGFVAILLLGLPSVASALDLQTVERVVDAQGTSFCPGCGPNGEDESFTNGETIPSSSPGRFDEEADSVGSYAFQSSDVTTDIIFGVGGIELGFTGDNSGRSDLLVEFTVPAPTQVRLFGDISTSPGGFFDAAFVAFADPLGDLLRADAALGPVVFDELFALQPGTLYRLEARLSGQDFSGTSSFGDWSVFLVPEPATALLLGLGLAVLARPRSRSLARVP